MFRFLRVEFCLIIGLKFGELPDMSRYGEVVDGIHHSMNESPMSNIDAVNPLIGFPFNNIDRLFDLLDSYAGKDDSRYILLHEVDFIFIGICKSVMSGLLANSTLAASLGFSRTRTAAWNTSTVEWFGIQTSVAIVALRFTPVTCLLLPNDEILLFFGHPVGTLISGGKITMSLI
ncbi:hypothetical protein JRO89_XS04G0177600 [Xanthoceras sorbifolium]|uniref:Uncharacterized protein n=1 Tax=Xanthoceras sorbifolium TaxID=99658 RepID=A0ABQ8I668_9ROSI|nr:hypothetical protein JRO89_XS04G0177600 [Xanthoceras sorbifolium]